MEDRSRSRSAMPSSSCCRTSASELLWEDGDEGEDNVFSALVTRTLNKGESAPVAMLKCPNYVRTTGRETGDVSNQNHGSHRAEAKSPKQDANGGLPPALVLHVPYKGRT